MGTLRYEPVIEDLKILLVDGRPYGIRPASKMIGSISDFGFPSDCAYDRMALLPGELSVHFEFQYAGWSPLVKDADARGALVFDAEPGGDFSLYVGRNWMRGGWKCHIEDEGSGSALAENRACGSWEADYSVAGTRTSCATFEVALTYARCGVQNSAWVAARAHRIEDPVEAYIFVRLAEQSGDASVSGKLQEVLRRMTPEQIAEAGRRFENWEPARQCDPIFGTESPGDATPTPSRTSAREQPGSTL